MPIKTEQMNDAVRGLVALGTSFPETGPALEALARLTVTYEERVCEVDETATTLGMDRGNVVYWFKALARIGCGRFIVGRKGGRSRFEWWFDPVSVYSAALKQRNDLVPLMAPDDGPPTEDWDALFVEEGDGGIGEAPSGVPDSSIEHIFMLRPGLPVRFILPGSLTKVEAERLSAFIRTLPFG